MVRTQIVIGSRKSRVKLPNNARIRIATGRRYFTRRQFSGTFSFFFQDLAGWKISSRVPNGHNQPHQARPKTRASKDQSQRDQVIPPGSVRAAMDWAIINRGSSRIGKLTTAAGQASPVEAMTSRVNTAKEIPCTTLRAVTQFEPEEDRLSANRQFLYP